MEEVGISWNLLVVGVEEDSELLVLNLAQEGVGGSEVNLVEIWTNAGQVC